MISVDVRKMKKVDKKHAEKIQRETLRNLV